MDSRDNVIQGDNDNDNSDNNENNPNDDQRRITRHRQQLLWRRDHVQELSSKGHTEREIAEILKLSQGTIHRDLATLKLRARKQISKYIDEQLPAEYHKCLIGLNIILRRAWELATDRRSEAREKLAAMVLIKDCYSMRIDLLSNATVIDRAIKFVDRHRGSMPQNREVRIDQYMETAQTTDNNSTNFSPDPDNDTSES
jgi:hypothetical protein